MPRAVGLRMPAFCLLWLAVLLGACSQAPELVENNDPSRYSLASDVLWSSPDGTALTMDIYTPKAAAGSGPAPVLVMFHGGGWLVNDKSIMRQSAAYLATHGRYVICNVNYRLLGDQGNTVTLDEIVEDAMGAVLWVQENIARFGGDPAQVAVTGDSAGGHLSAMVVNSGTRLSASGIRGESPGFTPSYLPPGRTAESVREAGGIRVQAAILSYGAFDIEALARAGFESWSNVFWLMGGAVPRGVFGDDISIESHPHLYRLVSPAANIPAVAERQLPPQLLTVGTEDTLTTPALVGAYAQALRDAGQPVAYWEHDGRPHAFLDAGSNAVLGIRFEDDAPPALAKMLQFLDSVFDPAVNAP